MGLVTQPKALALNTELSLFIFHAQGSPPLFLLLVCKFLKTRYSVLGHHIPMSSTEQTEILQGLDSQDGGTEEQELVGKEEEPVGR